MDVVRACVLISGRVQGVCFRHYTRREAEDRDITGWVRNCPDGKVEAVFEGKRDDVEGLVSWCRRGPSGASVIDVKVDWGASKGEFDSFSIRGW